MSVYKIKSLKGLKFEGSNGHIEIVGGLGLHVEGKGFISFVGANESNGIKTPYSNKRKVLQSIIDQGGLVNFDNVEFITV